MSKRYYPLGAGAIVTSQFGPRWGSQHRGTDFGRVGGSANNPVYAAQGGTIVFLGAASGFGGPDPCGWVVIDHPTADGGGTTVYGHIVRLSELYVGQRVEAGQLIGHVNPNRATNGNVDPHLHFEVHPTVWAQGSQIDPIPWLSGAEWIGGEAEIASPINSAGTVFGIDVSEHQDGMSLRQARDEGIEFAILRLCDGTYIDRVFQSHLRDAESAGLLVSTYWYLRAPSEGSTISQQVDVIDKQLRGRKDLGVWIDVESVQRGTNRKLLTGSDVAEAKRELERRGYHAPGIYTGAWYWENMPGGEPSMAPFGYLWVSHYGSTNQAGPYRQIYPGNHSDRWHYPLGDRRPDILQYGSRGYVCGREVDVNAFRGTREELANVLGVRKSRTILEEIMSDRITSLVNPSKSFDGSTLVALIDKCTWENRVLLTNLYRKLGLDPDETLREAIAKDNQAA